MADCDASEGGKSKKKNQKRRGKKVVNRLEDPSYEEPTQPEYNPVEELKQRLAEAKLNKDHGLASKLRQQLWIVQDLAAGVEPRVDRDDKEGQALVRQFQETGILSLTPQESSSTTPSPAKETSKSAPVSAVGDVIEDKRLKNLHKKLKQIETLKEKQKNGEKLETNQLEKIKSEASVKQEIQEFEELISKVAAEIKR